MQPPNHFPDNGSRSETEGVKVRELVSDERRAVHRPLSDEVEPDAVFSAVAEQIRDGMARRRVNSNFLETSRDLFHREHHRPVQVADERSAMVVLGLKDLGHDPELVLGRLLDLDGHAEPRPLESP